MKKLIVAAFLFLNALGVYYVWPETSAFPPPPSDAVQSFEPADVESPLRRSYFTNFNREEVINHYKSSFVGTVTMELNYPPEDAQIYIRDQARSWYLEELVHPLRESVFINGFIPQKAQDEIWHEGEHYYQKITIRLVPSSRPVRVGVTVGSVTMFGLLVLLLQKNTYSLVNSIKKSIKHEKK